MVVLHPKGELLRAAADRFERECRIPLAQRRIGQRFGDLLIEPRNDRRGRASGRRDTPSHWSIAMPETPACSKVGTSGSVADRVAEDCAISRIDPGAIVRQERRRAKHRQQYLTANQIVDRLATAPITWVSLLAGALR